MQAKAKPHLGTSCLPVTATSNNKVRRHKCGATIQLHGRMAEKRGFDVTISSTTDRASFEGNGVASSFSLPFRLFSNGDIQASLVDAVTGRVTALTLGTDYSLQGAGAPEQAGSPESVITMVVAPKVGKTLFVQRVMEIVQPTDIVNQGRFFPEVHETVFDRLTMMLQQGAGSFDRALRVRDYDPVPGRLPGAAQRANRILSFDATGNPVAVDAATDSSLALRQDLAATGLGKGTELIGGLPLFVSDVATLRETPGRFAGDRAELQNYLAGDGKGRRSLTWVASAAADDGGMRFAATGGHWLSDLNADGRVDAQFYGLPLASGSCITQDAAIEAYCFAKKVSAWYGPGIYDFGDKNWSWSGIRTAGNALKDYKGVRIYSTPLATFRTTSVGGADVMQCCGIKDFGVIGYPTVTAILNKVDDTRSGSNALSLVFGAVDCVFELTVKDMPGIYKTTGAIDGGQGFSIQPGAGNTNPYRNVILRGSVDGATQGFGCDYALDNQVDYPLMGIRLDLDIANCYRGVVIAGAAATVAGAAYTGITGSVRVRNCQQSYLNIRSLGTNLDVEVVNTLPKESLVKHASNPSVFVTNILASKDGAARVYGRVLTVDTLLNIGGTSMGGGQIGSTSEFTLEHAVTFSGATNQVVVVDSGGNAVDKSRISLSHVTAGYTDLSTKGSNTVQVNGAIIAPTAYPGDASVTAVAGPTFKAVYAAALTAVRSVTFASGARQGDTVRVVRLAAATGGGVSVGGLVNISAGTWADATYNGSAWAITGQGSV